MEINGIDKAWDHLLNNIQQLIGKRPADVDAVLFLIGVQELGKGPKRFSKEVKQDLMHVGVCSVLSQSGYYTLDGYDKEGWPHWTLIKPIPYSDLTSQEGFLKEHIITYFSHLLS